jgi:hypothetical protein
MKTKTFILTAVLTLGAALPGWTKSVPIGPGVSVASAKVGLGVWTKRGPVNGFTAGSLVEVGPSYRNCPVMESAVLNSKHESEVTLSNGKRIMLFSAGLKGVVEANLGKYQSYLY